MKACVDTTRCVWCGRCSEICPDVFATKDQVTNVVADPVPAHAEESCQEAMHECPLEAIAVI